MSHFVLTTLSREEIQHLHDAQTKLKIAAHSSAGCVITVLLIELLELLLQKNPV